MKNNRKAVDERHMQILNTVREKGEVRVEDLAEKFNISLMTVRRDLQYLEREKLITRIHGGAVSPERAHTKLTPSERISICQDRISEYASRFIEDGDRIFINGSRTALNMLKYVGSKKVTVYTNNCWALGTKYPEGVTINFTGGTVRHHVMVGEYVMRNLLSMTADKTFLGCAAIYEDGEFCYDIPTEIGINESMIARTTKEVYILAVHNKLRKRDEYENAYGSCSYDRPCTFITDEGASPSALDQLRKHGISVIAVPSVN